MILFVSTYEDSGIDRYSQQLNRLLGVPVVQSRRYLSAFESLRFLLALRNVSSLVHFPSQHFGRYGFLLRKPFIISVHDLVRMCFPVSQESPCQRMGLRLDTLGLKRACHIIAVSSCTKADLVRCLNIPDTKISVIYNGVDQRVFRPVAWKYFDFPFVLYVGSERPRKNLETLLKAFLLLKRETNVPRNLKLVKYGSAGRNRLFRRTTLEKIRFLGLEDEVIFKEYTSDEDLAICYSSATALVMPSLYEGFGLPVVEAMSCGCPVIASNCSSLPEVAGSAALFFSPLNHVELAHALCRVIAEPNLRLRLVTEGLSRAKYFSWETAAAETKNVYHRVIDELDARGFALDTAKELVTGSVPEWKSRKSQA